MNSVLAYISQVNSESPHFLLLKLTPAQSPFSVNLRFYKPYNRSHNSVLLIPGNQRGLPLLIAHITGFIWTCSPGSHRLIRKLPGELYYFSILNFRSQINLKREIGCDFSVIFFFISGKTAGNRAGKEFISCFPFLTVC